MTRGEAMELCCALREIAHSLELLIHQEPLPMVEPEIGAVERSQLPESEQMDRALVELWRGLHQVLGAGSTWADMMSEEQARTLAALGRSHGHKNAGGVLKYLIASVCDGVRRPGSWERGCVEMLFGGDAIREAEGS